MEQAMFWQTAADGEAPSEPCEAKLAKKGKIDCGLCPHHCRIADGKSGLCGIRTAKAGRLYAAGYGLISSAHNDPIEKKPLYHFHPGKSIFSVGGWGCNFKCKFCQNWTISQQVNLDTMYGKVGPHSLCGRKPKLRRGEDGGTGCPAIPEEKYPSHHLNSNLIPPDKIVAAAGAEQSIGIAYTYNEPLINIEFVSACARLAREAGLVNVLVTNGFIEKKPAEFILPLIDALNIDIKSMEEDFYKNQCSASLKPVLEFAKQAVAASCHVEITNLIIPGLNDSDEQIRHLAEWISGNLGQETPLHLIAYHPQYKMDLPATPAETLKRAFRLCKEKLQYVYIGNVFSDSGQNTLCPKCGNVLIIRRGYNVRLTGLKEKNCASCGRLADIILENN